MKIKCQLDATEVFIAELIACFVVESVLQQACVRLVCTSVGLAGLGLEALVTGCHNGRLK